MGLPAFQLPMFAKCDAVPNEICSTCLNLSHAGKQRVLSRSCRLQDLLDYVHSDCVQDLDYVQDVDCPLSCDM